MGLRIRKRIRIMPGVHLNLGKKGMSVSLGGRGATVNLSKRGTATTLGIPGTGISYTSRSKKKTADLREQQQSIPQNQATSAAFGYAVIAGIIGALIGGVLWGAAGAFPSMLVCGTAMYFAGKK